MELKEQLDSFLEKARERLTTPFIITYVLVWLIHHWRLAYIITSFDIRESRASRKQQIEDYITSNDGWWGMALVPVFWAVGSILIYYAVTLLAEVILFYFQLIQTEVRRRINDGRKIVTIEEFNIYYNRSIKLENRNVELEKKSTELSENFEIKSKESEKEIFRLEAVEEKLKLEKSELNNEIEKLKKTNSDIDVEKNQISKILEASELRVKELEKKLDDTIKKTNADIDVEKNHTSKILEASELRVKELEKRLDDTIKRNIESSTETDIAKKELEQVKLFSRYKNSIPIDSDNLGNIFGKMVIWDFYLNNKKIESIRYDSEEGIMYSTNGTIKITNIKISEQHGIIMFNKNTSKFSDLTCTLIKTDEKTLIGIEGNNNAKYIKTEKLVLY